MPSAELQVYLLNESYCKIAHWDKDAHLLADTQLHLSARRMEALYAVYNTREGMGEDGCW